MHWWYRHDIRLWDATQANFAFFVPWPFGITMCDLELPVISSRPAMGLNDDAKPCFEVPTAPPPTRFQLAHPPASLNDDDRPRFEVPTAPPLTRFQLAQERLRKKHADRRH